ncbi:hypothetical protein Arnit_0176 [Arcobacter nitrofigilis DSM 7299]|uniref:Helix-turn-helix domain-containing protein n=1 Tax=Arcobacter nitrofigilis (strain ATCC 33309 / DSM 7299 / CCUG 15893 / LMG 7604 / NCTC 12251 / CI) TaxID=572480 RepID=D5V4B0_ARCNC|nr:helix-turn-helix domain-containing protein [Arcobacter nitrofigilis]ADG91843.1 hypothetical protein Arnit_0176 [Arcobacter nitrofigilis DSM 7299]
MTLEELNFLVPIEQRSCICLNQSQTAHILGVSSSTLSNWRLEDGIGPEYKKVGNGTRSRVLYPKTAIIDWISKTIKTA